MEETELGQALIESMQEALDGERLNNAWRKYPHVERLENDEVEGLLLFPELWVEPKIDGANASILKDSKGILRAAKRSQVLGDGVDFRGLVAYTYENQEKFLKFFELYPNTIIYGEWLVKHTISWYRPLAYNKFYAFDVLDLNTGYFWRPDIRLERLGALEINQVIPIAKVPGPAISTDDAERLQRYADLNRFLIDETDKVGEGVVIKAFNGDIPYVNKYGRTTWAKIVRQEFKEQNTVAMGIGEVAFKEKPEQKFVDQFVTEGRVEKLKQKIMSEHGTGWQSKYIPEILGKIYYDVFSEELWGYIKKERVNAIDFKVLQQLTILRTKLILGL